MFTNIVICAEVVGVVNPIEVIIIIMGTKEAVNTVVAIVAVVVMAVCIVDSVVKKLDGRPQVCCSVVRI